MVVVTGNWRIWMAGMAASLVIFAVVFFAVIKPSSDTANQAIKSGLQQSQQVINQAQKQLGTAEKQAGSAEKQAGAAAGAVSTQAQQQLSNASKLAACVSAAGTDVAKATACQVKFAH
jgi:F0F1-type ATP synthase membrane subunit b/b'